MDRARQVCARVCTCVYVCVRMFRGLAGMTVNSITKEQIYSTQQGPNAWPQLLVLA